jgi:two-component system, LuxR family, response regulator FixJ
VRRLGLGVSIASAKERSMATVHLFSENPGTIGSITGALSSTCVVHLYRSAARLPDTALAFGGCVVVDMDEPAGWWRATLAEVIAKPFLPIVLVTARPVARDIVLAVRLGARDVIDWAADSEGLRAAVRELTVIEPEIMQARRTRGCRLDLLTSRQRQILGLASTGMASKEIARALSLSTRTVEAHRVRMVKRLMAKSFLELVRQQIQQEA